MLNATLLNAHAQQLQAQKISNEFIKSQVSIDNFNCIKNSLRNMSLETIFIKINGY